jgi:type 1 glutamine amidotransferase
MTLLKPPTGPGTTRVAVVTGRHPFDVLAFHDLFRSMRGIDAYVQHMEEFSASPEAVRSAYDVLLFYNMHLETPTDQGQTHEKRIAAALGRIGSDQQGVFVLHHALLAFPDWSLWSEVVGIDDRRFASTPRQQVRVDVVDARHPITRRLRPWTARDEVYAMRDADAGSEVLLETGHPGSMRSLAWAREVRQSRVFCLQLGHDGQAFADPRFRAVVSRGIRWCARKL